MTQPTPISPTQAEAKRDIAWDRYLTIPHADPRDGLAEYHAELRAIAEKETTNDN